MSTEFLKCLLHFRYLMYRMSITKEGKRKSRSDPIKVNSRAAYNLYVVYMFSVTNRIALSECLQNTWILTVREHLTSVLASKQTPDG